MNPPTFERTACRVVEGAGEKCDLDGWYGINSPYLPTRPADSCKPGSHDQALLVVGEAPGYHEDMQRKSWVGPAGKLLQGMLKASRLYESVDIYLSNACRCRPPKNETPSKTKIKSCFPLLREDISRLLRHYKNRVTLLCMGASACRSVLGSSLTGAMNSQGQRVCLLDEQGQVVEVRVFATFHPAYVLRQRSQINVVRDHFLLLERVLTGKQQAQLEEAVPLLGAEPDEINPEPADGVIALDIETYGALRGIPQTAFHPVKSRHLDGQKPQDLIKTVAIAWVDGAGEEHSVGFIWPRGDHRRAFCKWLDRIRKRGWWILGQNLSFDLMYLRTSPQVRRRLERFSVRVEDLILWNFLHSELRPERSLKSLSKLFDLAKYRSQNFDAPSASDPSLLAYNALDCRATLRARGLLREAIARDYGPDSSKLQSICREHCSDLVWTTTSLQEDGIPFDPDKLQGINDDKLTVVNLLEAVLLDKYNLVSRGAGSQKSQDAFVEQAVTEADLLDHPDLLLTEKTQKISTKEANLHLIANHLPPGPTADALGLLLKSRKARKIEDTYTRPLLNQPARGIVHTYDLPGRRVGMTYPGWYPCPSKHDMDSDDRGGGTIQARITARHPAVQTFPRIIKACETSRYVGGYILDADYSQIELRIAGLLSGDEAFLDIYQQGKDVHLLSGDLLTQACLGKPAGWLLDQYERVGKDEEPVRTWRQIGKTANFLVIYEGQSFKLCMTVRNDTGYEMSQPAAAEFIYNYDQRHRGLRQWQEELVQTAITKGFIELPFGWSRMFLGGRATADEERATICNFPVQATAALLLESAQARIIEEVAYRGLHSRCDKNVYDSIRIDCHPTELPVMREIVDRWLTRPPLLEYLEGVLGRSMPITHDLKITRSQ